MHELLIIASLSGAMGCEAGEHQENGFLTAGPAREKRGLGFCREFKLMLPILSCHICFADRGWFRDPVWVKTNPQYPLAGSPAGWPSQLHARQCCQKGEGGGAWSLLKARGHGRLALIEGLCCRLRLLTGLCAVLGYEQACA